MSRNGAYAATISRDIILWDASAGTQIGSAHPFKHPASIDFDLATTRLAAKNTSGEICVLYVPTLEIASRLTDESWGEGSELLFSSCGNFLIDGSWDGSVCVRDSKAGSVKFSQRHEHAMVTALSASAARDLFAYIVQPKMTDNRSPPPPSKIILHAWPFVNHSPTYLHGEFGLVTAVALDPTGSRLAILHHAGPLEFLFKIYSLNPLKELASRAVLFAGTSHAVLAWSPDCRYIACVEEGKVSCFEAADLSLAGSVAMTYPCAVQFSPDGSKLALGSWTEAQLIPAQLVYGCNA